MNKLILFLIGVVILGGAAMVGMFSTQPKDRSNVPAASASCLDFNPPSTTDKVTLGGQTYGLIKNNAEIREESKFREMKKIGEIDSKSVYIMNSSNLYGQSINSDIIFVLQNTIMQSPYVFNIYIKDGVPIPDEIINCKSTGGRIAVVYDTVSFPPSAFNRTDIINLSDSSVAPGYAYSGLKATFDFVKNLPGVKNVGSLKIASKGSNLPLYFHSGIMYLVDGNDAYEYFGSSSPVDLTQSKKSLQLQKVTFVQTPTYSWYTPSCKPAIYLYPTKRERVNVRVETSGIFTLTIPDYSENGWNIIANPNGIIESEGQTFKYLYYESKIPDSLVKVPDKGYVVTRSELPGLFNLILPKLGLATEERNEFNTYWLKALPYSPYYFVGVMDKKSIDSIEPLIINPAPDSINRVRLYFELLEKPKVVAEPIINTPERKGFSVIEWGGMVKTDKDHPFTCSQ